MGNKMRFLSLFTGIGGFDLGLERAGMECAGQVENDDFCRKVLAKHWPDVKRMGDIHDVNGNEFGAIDLICGGYPCQCDSTAGDMRGKDDDRWLWPEMFRIIQNAIPDWVIGENVINHENMGLKLVKSDLERAGYKVRPFIIPSAACGLPTVERHIWIIAASPRIGFQGSEDIHNAYYGKTWEFQGTDKGIEKRWSLPESRVCRKRQGVSFQVDRIKSLGNAVSPQIPEIIGRCIVEINNLWEFYGKTMAINCRMNPVGGL